MYRGPIFKISYKRCVNNRKEVMYIVDNKSFKEQYKQDINLELATMNQLLDSKIKDGLISRITNIMSTIDNDMVKQTLGQRKEDIEVLLSNFDENIRIVNGRRIGKKRADCEVESTECELIADKLIRQELKEMYNEQKLAWWGMSGTTRTEIKKHENSRQIYRYLEKIYAVSTVLEHFNEFMMFLNEGKEHSY